MVFRRDNQRVYLFQGNWVLDLQQYIQISKDRHHALVQVTKVGFFINMRKQPQEVFYEECVLKNFAKITGKHLCYTLFVDEVAGRLSLNKRLSLRCFPVNFGKFLKAPSLPSFQATASEYMQNKSKYWLIKFLKEQHFICFNKISTCFQCIQNFLCPHAVTMKCHVQILSGCSYMVNPFMAEAVII